MTSTPTTPFPAATITGYPRIGRRRELKKALEAYWAGRSSRAELEAVAAELQLATYRKLVELGLGAQDASLPAAFSLYDQVLDTATALGAVPARFADLADAEGRLGLDAGFVLARGDAGRPPLELTKWFDTNYHYLVPEIGPGTPFRADPAGLVADVRRAAEHGFAVRPVLVGPVSFLLLAKADDDAPAGFDPLERLPELVPVYAQLLRELAAAGAQWVQLEEPALVADQHVPAERLAEAVWDAYTALTAAAERPQVFVTTPYGSPGPLLHPLAASGIEALHLDLVAGTAPSAEELELFQEEDAPVLVAGAVDGHNVWRADLAGRLAQLAGLSGAGVAVSVASSTSLFHVPHDVAEETQLDPLLRSWLSFADQKVAEIVTLSRGLADGAEAVAGELAAATEAGRTRAGAPGVRDAAVRERAGAVTGAEIGRAPAEVRRRAQEGRSFTASGPLPPLPTTTIGSFPQTPQVRAARAKARSGRIGAQDYDRFLREEIERVVRLQEELGLDVLVHGEAERNDMVQYFAEHLDGFATTVHGWVQSYGSRCTRPSILWGDVSREGGGVRGEAFTVPWIGHAQSLTDRPVKGMLTGPVTILAWSFVRDDQPLAETAEQVALALRDEVADLEAAGIGIVQVDEPALRELLPLRRADQPAYLDWSVRAFRLATSGVRDETQIHTHLCYSEFGEVVSAIDGLDADVTSIEAARSRMEVLTDLEAAGFSRGIGPGTWDIHSPRVPSQQEIEGLLERALAHVPASTLWVNPDCGLKTRGYAETRASLEHLVAAARAVRERITEPAGVPLLVQHGLEG
ncbi:5-methyltetrahydropteroyltriglutamate--homocysteine S-methyltransferase [Kocuria rosea]|uniref:5-methyltetrahydropteroyltriglutamate-- homocysteine S-methyltransferase n=1 Tax=Kocuria rosea TaxID=1275 RepID=UPI0020423302|nr:5-methyltetrahydropteroyltriglutamate--homocysteine S-methyltransferase [Kocuria rosea]MCM3686647.1 5-methyltetrahydropteroyltriglutamate--homocysteine S-methyltransferase [Kocuria rosea]